MILKYLLPEPLCTCKDWDLFGLTVFVVSDQRNALKVGPDIKMEGCSPSSDVCTFNHPPNFNHPPTHPPKYQPVDRGPSHSNSFFSLQAGFSQSFNAIFQCKEPKYHKIIFFCISGINMWSLVPTHSAFIQPATLEFRHSLNLTYLTVLVAFLVIICDIGASSRPWFADFFNLKPAGGSCDFTQSRVKDICKSISFSFAMDLFALYFRFIW